MVGGNAFEAGKKRMTDARGFAFRVCEIVGCAHPDLLPITYAQLLEWAEYRAQYGLISDWHNGSTLALLANVNSRNGGFTPPDFMPYYLPLDPTHDDLVAKVKAIKWV